MNYESIARAFYTRRPVVGHRQLVAQGEQNQLHLTNDGKADDLTTSALDTPAIEIAIVDSSISSDLLLDLSNVDSDDFIVDDDFDPETLISTNSNIWKLIEVSVDSDGTIALVFLNVRDVAIGHNNTIINAKYTLVPVNSFGDHLTMLVNAENNRRQYCITQDLIDEEAYTYRTSILEICNGRKINYFYSNGIRQANGRAPTWGLIEYGPAGE